MTPYGPPSMERTRTALGASERVMGVVLLGFSMVRLLRGFSKQGADGSKTMTLSTAMRSSKV